MQVGFIIGKYWKKNGLLLKLTITTNTQRLEVANIIKKNLESIGFQIRINEISNLYYKNNLQKLNYDILLTGNTVSIKPEIQNYLDFNIEKTQTEEETYENAYKEFKEKTNFTGLYFNSIILVHSKKIKGNFAGNWYNIYHNIDTWYKIK